MKTSLSTTSWLPESRMPSASQLSCGSTPGASAGIVALAMPHWPSSSAMRTRAENRFAAGEKVAKDFRPLSR